MKAKRRAEGETEATGVEQRRRLEGVAGYLSDPAAGKFDRLVYERVRLGIMSALAVNAKMTFNELKELLRASDGNLSAHARKLEDAGYIDCKKSFKGRFPLTEYRLTADGRQALERYLNHMERLIQATRAE